MTAKIIQQVSCKAGLEHGSSGFQPRCLSKCCYTSKSLRFGAESGLISGHALKTTCWIKFLVPCCLIFLSFLSQIKLFSILVFSKSKKCYQYYFFCIFFLQPQWAWKDIGKIHCYLWLICQNPWLPQTRDELHSEPALWHLAEHTDSN